jgi:hypothetical protein
VTRERLELANILILLGAGLTAWGISGFSGDLGNGPQILPEVREELSGSFGWSIEQRLEIVAGVLSLTGGLLLRGEPRHASHT